MAYTKCDNYGACGNMRKTGSSASGLCIECFTKHRRGEIEIGDGGDFDDDDDDIVKAEMMIENLRKVKGPESWRDVLRHCDTAGKFIKERRNSQESVDISIKTESPIAIAFSGDWHLGAYGTDYAEFEKFLDLMLNTPNLYVTLVGDEFDNFFNFKSVKPILDQVIPPSIQHDLVEGILDAFLERRKILAAGFGNHTSEFFEKAVGFDIMAKLTRNKVPYFGAKGILNVKVNDIEYGHLVTHKSRYNSFLNKFHANRREFDLASPEQVIVVAHNHNPDIATEFRYGRQNFYVRCGTYKTDCDYSARYFGNGRIGNPTLVYHPNINKIVPFLETTDAIEYMKRFSKRD